MESHFQCPYCQTKNSIGSTLCSGCSQRFPWSNEVEDLRNEIKSREPSRVRAVLTLADEIQSWAAGGKPPSPAAIKGLIYSLLFPRLVLVVGSVAASAVLIAQTVIMYRQNEILSAQTTLSTAQSVLMRDAALAADAQRFLPLYPELTQLLNDMNELGRSSSSVPEFQTVPLPDPLASRIVTLSRAFRPYWYIDSFSTASDLRDGNVQTTKLPMVFLSPERGLLLKALLGNRLDVRNLTSADFSYADMRGTEISGFYPEDSHYTVKEFGSCEVIEATKDLATSAYLKAIDAIQDANTAQLVHVWDLEPLELRHADFSKSKLTGVRLADEHGTMTFGETDLTNVTFASVRKLDLSESRIFSVSVSRVDGQTPARVIVSRARFMNEPLCSGEPLYRSDEDLTITHPDIGIRPEDAVGVFVRKDLLDRKFLNNLRFDLDTPHESGVAAWDFKLFQSRPK
jgi:uncharacterized protein YjbI with pentapeptide repeats